MKKIGDLGENLVGRWLQLQNYELIEKNWRCRWGEIDLIAQDRLTQTIAFVEVKTRSQKNWDLDGLLAVDSVKQQKLIQTASLFLAKFPHLADFPCRFDIGLIGYQAWHTGIIPPVDLLGIEHLEIGQSITLNNYRLTIKNYLQAAFE